MARRVTTLVLPVALSAIALAGCGSEKPSNDVTSPSPSSTSAGNRPRHRTRLTGPPVHQHPEKAL